MSELKAHDLGALVIKEVLDRANILPSDVSEVILGQVTSLHLIFLNKIIIIHWLG